MLDKGSGKLLCALLAGTVIAIVLLSSCVTSLNATNELAPDHEDSLKFWVFMKRHYLSRRFDRKNVMIAPPKMRDLDEMDLDISKLGPNDLPAFAQSLLPKNGCLTVKSPSPDQTDE